MEKRSVLVISMLLSLGLYYSCSSDNQHIADEVVKINDLHLLYGNQAIKTFCNHPGIVHYDGELKMWYLDYSYNQLLGVAERYYTETIESDYQVDGLYVTFSGEAFDFSSKKKNKVDSEYNYYLKLQSISRSNCLHPLTEVAPEIKVFFDKATSTEGYMRCQFDLPERNLEEKMVDTCFVINSQDALTALYTGQEAVPDIDFDKYTIVIGRAYMLDTGESLAYHDVSADVKNINLYIEAYQTGFDVIKVVCFWGLYPKFESDKLNCNRNVTIIEVNNE